MATYGLKKGVYGVNLSANSSYSVINIDAISGVLYVSSVNGLVTLYDGSMHALVTFNPNVQEIQSGAGTYAFNVSSKGLISYHIDTLNLDSNYGVTSVSGEHFIGTNNHVETLYSSTNFTNVTSTANIDNISLSGFNVTSADYVINSANHTVSFTNGGSTIYLTDSISTAAQTIATNNALGTIQNVGGIDTLTWTKYNMGVNESFKTLNDGMTINGNTGKEGVEIIKGMHNETIASNVEVLKLDDAYSTYSFSASGQALVVKDAGGKTVATYNTANNASYTLNFADGSSHTLSNHSSSIYFDAANLTSPSSAPTTPTTNPTTGHMTYALAIDNFSDAYLTSSAISTDFKNAIGDIAKYVNTLGTLDIAVHFENVASNVLAFFSGDGNNNFTQISSTLQSSFKGANYATEFQLEQKTGIDYNGSVADMNITINLGSDKYLSTSGVATAGKYDLTTILEHEIMHGLGITGFIGTSYSSTAKTEFDTYVNAPIASAPYFSDGTTTIQLAPASAGAGSAYYHVASQSDLMNSALSSGQIKHISTTDLTILTDLGYNVVNHVIA